jgi:hypothetical protein
VAETFRAVGGLFEQGGKSGLFKMFVAGQRAVTFRSRMMTKETQSVSVQPLPREHPWVSFCRLGFPFRIPRRRCNSL